MCYPSKTPVALFTKKCCSRRSCPGAAKIHLLRLIYVGDDDTIQQAFGVTPKDGTVFLPRVMSRKKQIIPMLSALWG